MKRIILYPYKLGSVSAVELQMEFSIQGFRCLRVKSDGNYIPRPNDVIINWGNSNFPWWSRGFAEHEEGIYNRPSSVARATNKINTFAALTLADILVVPYTTHQNMARDWLSRGSTVICRTKVQAHSGDGIIIARPEDMINLPDAPLYTKYKKKKHEFRVHIMDGVAFDIQEKKMERDFIRTADQGLIRSHNNGWVFCRDSLQDLTRNFITRLEELSIAAISALGLDFGAVDIIYNEREDNFYVLEVNTAVGLEGVSIQNYVNSFIVALDLAE